MTIDCGSEEKLDALRDSVGPVLVDFFAPWCGPCRRMAPVLEEMAAEYPGLKVLKVDVDQDPALAARYQVRGVPTFVLLKDGRELRRVTGALPKAELARSLQLSNGA